MINEGMPGPNGGELHASTATSTANSRGARRNILRGVRLAIAAAVWSVIVLKLFLYDVDVFLVARIYPRALPLLAYRFLAIGAVLLICWWLLGTRRLALSLAYITLFPLVLVFWLLPKFMVLHTSWSWIRAFVVAYTLIVSLKDARRRLTLWFIGLIGCVLILSQSHAYLIICGMVALLVYLVGQFVRQFQSAFRPSRFLRQATELLGSQWIRVRDSVRRTFSSELDKYAEDSEERAKKKLDQLHLLFFVNRGLAFCAVKVRQMQRSRIVVAHCMLLLAHLFLLTVVVFGLEYYGLATVDPGSLGAVARPNAWFFLYTSFSTMVNASVADFEPISAIARALVTAQRTAALVVLLIFASTIVMLIRERYDEEVSDLIEGLNRAAGAIETMIVETYGMSLSAVESEVRKVSPGVDVVISYLDRR